jgi:hypothetical protein
MNVNFRFRTAAVVALLALGTAAPGVAVGHGNNGNHCGKGHPKHTKAVGKSCVKHHHGHGHHDSGHDED